MRGKAGADLRRIEEKIKEWEKESGIPLRLGADAEGIWIDAFYDRGREIVVKAAIDLTEREIQLVRWGVETALKNEGSARHPLWSILRGEASHKEQEQWLEEWGLTGKSDFRVACFHFQSALDQWHRDALNTLLEDEGVIAAGAGQEFLVLLNREDWMQWIRDRQGTAEAEWMMRVMVTVGVPVEVHRISVSYRDAIDLMRLLQKDPRERRWMTDETAELSVLIHRLSPEAREILLVRLAAFHLETLDEEEWHTAAAFWLHDLHSSQTAKALFIHRNTLQYRLERIRKKTGLDLRVYEEALRFQIARETWELEQWRQRGKSDSDDTI